MQNDPLLIDFKRLDKLCKGDQKKRLKFLDQFVEINSDCIEQIKIALKERDFQKTRKTIHFMSPQLVFFGLPEFSKILEKIESESIQSMSDYLIDMINEDILKVQKAIIEVESIVKTTINKG